MREVGVGRRPHRKTFIGENYFRIDAVANLILQPLLGIGAGLRPQMIFALQTVVEQARASPSLGDCPLDAIFVDFNSRQATAKLVIDPLIPEISRLVAVTVRRDHQVLVGVAGTRGAFPSRVSGSLESPTVGFIDFAFTDVRA